ncbi:type I polyketide synthase [Streptomyces sp. NPDC046727]|uniref:type I polyketide synthase n=1 Tax=Streptomyces sp. NPDC046727 TaxID=3155373 RepID=UPI0033E8D243
MRDSVAIIGMSIRTSGARDINEFWDLIRNAESGRHTLDHIELARRGVPYHRYTHADFVPVTYPLKQALEFDTEAFRFSATEAELTDPQHRLLLEECYRAVESSGHYIGSLPGVVGVYLGAKPSNHGALLERELWASGDNLELTRLAIGNHPDYLSSRVAYKYGLTGPALTVQTACSSSAVAIHLASQAILSGECDSAIVGGVAYDLQDAGYLYSEGGIYSKRGLCEPFMTTADGTVEGNGAVALFLRRLDVAVAAGDPVLAVIAGTAVNNDGQDRAGFSAPGVKGQIAVIEEALDVAELTADRIGLFEAHGTGTGIGDTLEVEAAARAWSAHGATRENCRLTSIKANVGHLAAAAGAAGVVAAVLAMQHEEIPPNLPLTHGATPMDLSDTPFVLSGEVVAWPRGEEPRHAAVSSFGLGGTNAHLILSDADISGPSRQTPQRTWQLLPLSADDSERLDQSVHNVRDLVNGASAEERSGLGRTLRTGRPSLAVRTSVVVSTHPSQADADWPVPASFSRPAEQHPDVIYLLPGQGGRTTAAAHELYTAEPAFAQSVDRGLALMRPLLTPRTYERIVAAFHEGSHTGDTEVAQPVLHLTSVGVHAFLDRLGLRPTAVLGHSVGEVTGAYLTGILSFEDAVRAVCRRASAMAEMAPGVMLAVRAAVEDLHGLPEECCVSVVNGPRAVVVGAAAGAADALMDWLDRQDMQYRQLETSHAFHHPSMSGAAIRFTQHLHGVEMKPPTLPLMSCRSGQWLTDLEATDPAYWGSQLRDRVDFARAVRTTATRYPDAVYVEIGPGTSLVSAVHRGGVAPEHCMAALPGADAHKTLLSTVGRLWERGLPVDWTAYGEGDDASRAVAPPRIFRGTPVLHARLAGMTPAIDPVDLDLRPRQDLSAFVAGPGPEPADELQPLVDEVVTCWAAVLGGAPGVADDFFAAGGDSISAGQLVARLRAVYPVDIPIHLPLTARTPQAIARALDSILIDAIANS